MSNFRGIVSVVGIIGFMHLTSAQGQDQNQNALEGPQPFGVNLAGAEFGGGQMPGEFGKQYMYPSGVDLDYFFAKGIKLLRLPFKWERLQHELVGATICHQQKQPSIH